MKAETYTNDELLGMLRAIVAKKSQAEVAREIRVSKAYLGRVLIEKKPVSERIAEWLLNCRVEQVYRKAS